MMRFFAASCSEESLKKRTEFPRPLSATMRPGRNADHAVVADRGPGEVRRSLRFPDPDASILPGGDHPVAVGEKADAKHRPAMVHRKALLAAVGVPQRGRVVRACGREQRARRAEGDRVDPAPPDVMPSASSFRCPRPAPPLRRLRRPAVEKSELGERPGGRASVIEPFLASMTVHDDKTPVQRPCHALRGPSS